jgi:hypothetical protein
MDGPDLNLGRTGTRSSGPLDQALAAWIKGDGDLILPTGRGSDSSGGLGIRAVAIARRRPNSTAAQGSARWSFSNPSLRGSKLLEPGSGVTSVARLTHLGYLPSLAGSGATRAAGTVALLGGAHRGAL